MTNGEKVLSVFEGATIHGVFKKRGIKGLIRVCVDNTYIVPFDLDWWNSEYKEKDAEKEVEAIKTEHNCLTCKYGNLYSDNEPCCNCTEDNDMFEPKDNEVENETDN